LLAFVGLLAFFTFSHPSVRLTSGWACCKYLFPFSFNIVAFCRGALPHGSRFKKKIFRDTTRKRQSLDSKI
jgi:hypothetical protein